MMKSISLSLVAGLLIFSSALGAAADTAPPDIVSPAGSGVAPVVQSSQDNMILNGDFEFSSYPPNCYYNQDNDSATGLLTAITVWGEANEIDYMNDGTDCGYGGPPQNGMAKLAIHRQLTGDADAFCFELDSPAVSGVEYLVSFYIRPELSFDPNISAVEVGLSDGATSFGTLVASGMGVPDEWTYVEQTFVASATGHYLCVRPEVNVVEAWNFLDNFRLETAPVAVEKISWGSIRSMYR